MARGQSYAGHESPVPRASTSSSSLIIPSVGTNTTNNTTIPTAAASNNNLNSTSPRGSFNQPHNGSPSSFSELERRRASSFGDAKLKGYRPL